MGWDEVCWADYQSLLFTGSQWSNSQFRIDVDRLQVYPVPTFPSHARGGAVVKHKGNFFRFDINKTVYKWDGKETNWNEVAELPSAGWWLTAVSVEDCILVTGRQTESMYAYYE